MNSKIYFNPSWAISRQGVSIPLWASHSPNSSSAPPILLIGGVHGDEPEGVWLAEALLNSLQTLYQRQTHRSLASQSNSPTRQSWVLIACLNPDGHAKNERTNAAGVDLNRNFPSPDWSTEAKAPRYYPGEKPASEPEVQGAMQAIEMYRPKLIIHFHSWKPCVVYTGAPAQPIAQSLGEYSGYAFHEDIGYPTPGSLGQYGWLSKQIPVVCIEEQEGAAREHIWPRFQGALMDLFL